MEYKDKYIKTEELAYWFFRLNGCLNLVNFLIHDRPGREGTDVDVLATRFPYRQELLLSGNPMADHPVFDSQEKIDLIIAEVKVSHCELNGPWTDPNLRNMQKMLYAIGAFPGDEVNYVANELYRNQYFENGNFRCRLFTLGRYLNQELNPVVVQLQWSEILDFIHDRFTNYERYKTQHRQWDPIGEYLYSTAIQNRRDSDRFINIIMSQLIA